MTQFTYDGYRIVLNKDENEDNEHFKIRGFFIAKQKPETKSELDIAIHYSRMYLNIKLYGTVYQQDIMDKINNMTSQK